MALISSVCRAMSEHSSLTRSGDPTAILATALVLVLEQTQGLTSVNDSFSQQLKLVMKLYIKCGWGFGIDACPIHTDSSCGRSAQGASALALLTFASAFPKGQHIQWHPGKARSMLPTHSLIVPGMWESLQEFQALHLPSCPNAEAEQCQPFISPHTTHVKVHVSHGSSGRSALLYPCGYCPCFCLVCIASARALLVPPPSSL